MDESGGQENPASSPTSEEVYQAWMQYAQKGDSELFKAYLDKFLLHYHEFIDVDFTHLNVGYTAEGPHLTRLPEGLLQLITKQLLACSDACLSGVSPDALHYASRLTQCLIVICRNLDNIALVASCEYVSHIVTIATIVLSKLSHENTEDITDITHFVNASLHFFECLYDPYFTWRKTLRGWTLDKSRFKFRPSLLHVEVVPFFYECFQQVTLDTDIQLRLFHVLGAIISGSQHNALRAICPATLDVLLKVLASPLTSSPPGEQSDDVMELKDVVLRCIIRMVHVIHCCSPDQRQVEVGAVLEGYFLVLLKLSEEQPTQPNLQLQLKMLNAIHDMLKCPDRAALQVIFVAEGTFNSFVTYLQQTPLTGGEAQKFAMAIVRVMSSIMSGSTTAKDKFKEKVGYSRFVDALKSLGQPSKELLYSLLDLVVEGTFEGGTSYPLNNVQAVLMLIQWLPHLQSRDLQLWLAESLRTVCLTDSQNRMLACREGVVGAVISVLGMTEKLSQKTIGHLIHLLETLGTLSITAAELKQLIGLLCTEDDQSQNEHLTSLVHAMSVMARRDGHLGVLHYFDLPTPESGLVLSNLRRWPGIGFTFHAWVRLNKIQITPSIFFEPTRRQLYCLTTTTGNGFEAFFTSDDILVIAVCIKKEYHTLAVTDNPLSDHKWHCIDIVHTSSKRPFSTSQLSVFIDGRQRLNSQLKFPPLTEPLTSCRIGCGIKSSLTVDKGPETITSSETKPKKFFPLPFFGSSAQNTSIVTLPAASLDSHFGVSESVGGQIGSVCIFHESLQTHQVSALSALGPNDLTMFQTEDSTIADLAPKLVLHYNAKACQGNVCLDLSFNNNHGRLQGQKCVTWDIKDVINCIGGVQVLFPLLEQVQHITSPQVSEPTSPVPTNSSDKNSPSNEFGNDEWVVVKSSSYADIKLEANPVAGVLALLRNMVQNSLVNQDSLVRTNSVAVLGALLQKVPQRYMDVNILMAIQLFVEAVAETSKALLAHIYQYLLFDFRIWSHSEFPVRIGHIQYLSTIIKEDRQHFRKKYGVQYMLDIIRTYYSDDEKSLSPEDCRTIRCSLLGLVKYYVMKDVTSEELTELLAFVCSVKGENMITEVLSLILTLLELPGKKDQIYTLMLEQNMAELLYHLLTRKTFTVLLKEKVLRIMSLLLKTDKVYDKTKSRLRLHEMGMYPGMVSFMLGTPVSKMMMSDMLDQVLMTDTANSYNAALSIVQLLHGSSVTIRLELTRKLLTTVFSKSTVPKMFARQVGWQEILVRLFIVRKIPVVSIKPSEEQILPPAPQAAPPDVIQSPLGLQIDQPEDFFLSLKDIDDQDGIDIHDPLMESFSTPRFDRPVLFDVSNSDDENSDVVAMPSRSSSVSTEDLIPGSQKRSMSLGVLTEFSQEDAEKLLTEPVTSKSVTDLASKTRIDTLTQKNPPLPSPIPSLRMRRESGGSDISLSSSQQEAELATALRKMGLSVKCEDSMEQEDELAQNVLLIIFTIMWKGVEGSDTAAWKLRGQVFAAINALTMEYELLSARITIVRRLIEMMLQGCIMDLKETGQTNITVTENAVQLIKMVYNFLCFEDESLTQEKFNERIIEDVMTLLDLMTVWDADNEWREMEQLGLSILLAFAAQQDLDLCSIASARLHTLLQTRPVDKLQESCAVISAIDEILVKGLKDQSDHYNFLIPVMKALVDKCQDLLNMRGYCPGLPNTLQGPAFFDDFKTYCQGPEWRSFMEKQVIPSKEQYEANTFDELKVRMKTYLGECHEDMMIDCHKRNRERGESRLQFQGKIGEAFTQKSRQENKRYHNISTQLRNQHAFVQRQWRAARGFFSSPRGAWAIQTQDSMYWKLSTQENFSRMRPKLTQNYSHDGYLEASRQRDNVGVEPALAPVPSPLEIAKVKVSDEDIGDDRLGDEEWNVISKAAELNKAGMTDEDTKAREKLILSEDCELITIMDVFKGRMEVTTTHIYFFDYSSNAEEGGEDFKLALSQLREIHFRRYNLRRSALELFLVDQTNYFLNFQKKIRNKVFSCILSLKPPNLRESIYRGSRSPAELLKASGLTQKWVQREISNFDYLMQLNTIAGRTYNDLSQYPVFPWILCDYSSETLDIDDPKIYRDLSKPVGAINPNNEQEIREKYDHFEDPSGMIEKFHYGTHYSNPASVMHYLIRLEPFTSLHIQLQSGKFDVADRQFHSMPASWESLMENPNDVKELIPEFFYLPEFLENLNGFDLGKLQITKTAVNDVVLPAWATSPEDFIYKHRKALESEYVSQNLHQWIDLIFGYKQKGPAAVEALNVFYYCTYEGAVDLDAVTDPLQQKALEGMINNFGQTPCQLLKEAHPRRMTAEEAISRATKKDEPLSILWFIGQLKAYYVEASIDTDPLAFVMVPRNQTRTVIQHGMPDAMIGVTEDGILCVHGWLPYDKSISNYFTFEKDPSMANTNEERAGSTRMLSQVLALGKAVGDKVGSMVHSRTKKRLAGPFAPGLKVTPKMFAVSHDAKLVFSGGHWDNSLRVYSITKGRMVAHIVRHTDIVTCLALDYCGSHVISGSKDTTCMIWDVTIQNGVSAGLNPKPLQILYGHDDEVTAVVISVELDMAVSSSLDGTVNIHTVQRGYYLRTLRPPCERGWSLSVLQMALSDIGQIVLYCHQVAQGKVSEEMMSLHLYSINGKHLSWEHLQQPLSHMAITDGHLIIGCQSGHLIFKELFGLTTITTMPLHVPVQCVAVTQGNSHILVGLRDGKLIIVGIQKSSSCK